jgi:hypothetical protein
LRRGILIVIITVLLAPIIWLLPGLIGVRSCRGHHPTSEVIRNMRQLGLVLFEFKSEYGKYPDMDSMNVVSENAGAELRPTIESSNDVFRQLIVSGVAQNETIFHFRTRDGKKPDNVMSGQRMLEKGEVGFSYISGLSPEENPSRPLIIAPLVPGTDRFDPEPLDGTAVILATDGSFKIMQIEKDGHVRVDGMNVLDPKHPVWAGEKWKLLWPE